MSDLIDRQAALDAVFNNAEHPDKAYGAIRHLPSAQRTGRWIKADTHNYLFFKNDRIYKCSNCGHLLDFEGVNGGRGDANYCPNCGAEMRE